MLLNQFPSFDIPNPAWTENEFTPTLGQTVFTLTPGPSETRSLSLFVNGVRADDVTDFTVVGTTLTWLDTDFSLDTSDKVIVRYV